MRPTCPWPLQILKEGNPIVPSETIEFVDAVIDYIKAVDDSVGSTTASLDDLIDARNDYSGPGSGLMGNQ